MAEKTLVPEAFGPLQGVKIVSSGTLIAQPFGAALAADMGAEVIQVERPGVGDMGWRTVGIRLKTRDGKGETATNWVQERRNVFCISLDLTPAARTRTVRASAPARRHLDGKFEGRDLSEMGARRRLGMEDQF